MIGVLKECKFREFFSGYFIFFQLLSAYNRPACESLHLGNSLKLHSSLSRFKCVSILFEKKNEWVKFFLKKKYLRFVKMNMSKLLIIYS